MNNGLPQYLLMTGDKVFAWGKCDCCTWVCDWALAFNGLDPAKAWRGRVKTALGAKRVLTRGGGLLALVSQGCESVGLKETTDPLPGDIGVVFTEQGEAMAIRTLKGWAVKSDIGFMVDEFKTLKAWVLE